MKRGDLVAFVFQGDFGKPRPALIVQSDLFNLVHPTTTVLPLTSDLRDVNLFRITVEASRENGLRSLSQIMVDKAMTLRHDSIGAQLGRLDEATLLRVNRSLAVWMGPA